MKHRFPLLFLLVLSLLLLNGCACAHEWLPADCLNPQICTKCEEIGEPALGHDWLNATCSASQTCTRCSETQGEALAHIYGEWSFTDERMTHTCSVCSFEESTELDRELYLSTLLGGWWDFTALYQDGSLQSAEELIYLDTSVFFGSDNCAIVTFPSKTIYEGVWEFESYAREGEQDIYNFTLPSDDSAVSMMLIQQDKQSLLTVISGDLMLVYTQNPEASQFVAGSWGVKPYLGAINIGADYWVNFHEDRTVEGYLNGPVNGTWLLVPMSDSQCGIVIRYDQAGEEQLIQVKMDLIENEAVFYLNRKLPFEKKDEDYIENIRMSREIILGTWTSLSLCDNYSPHYSLKSPEEITHEYSITFQADGTFSAIFGREYSGKWSVFSVSNETDTEFIYELYFDGQEDLIGISLDTKYNTLYCHDLPDTNNRTMVLAQLNEDALAFFSQAFDLVGTWKTGSGKTWTFSEDGTYTASLDSESNGTWEYRYFIIDDDCSHSYWIYPDNSTISDMIFISCSSGFVFGGETYHRVDSSSANP